MALKQKLILIAVFLFCLFIQVIPVIRSGLNYSYGIGFWGPNGHDTVWHLSLINHISDPLRIDMPVYSGSILQNYHPFFDILINALSRITHLSTSIWLFQIFPLLSAGLLLYLSFVFGRLVTGKFSGGLFLLILNSIANSFGWIFNLLKYGNFSGESIFWAMQSPSNQINPPYNLSLIFILILFLILYRHPRQQPLTIKESLIVFIMLVLLPVTKVYSALIGFSFFGLYSLFTIKNFRSYKNFVIFIISLLAAYFIFSLYNPHATGLLVYQPFWFINSMFESPDRIFVPYLANMRYTLESSGLIGPRLIALMLFSFLVFITGNFGWRLLGLLKTFKPFNFFKAALLFNITLLIIIPTLFIQKGTSWNTIQFLYYAMFLVNIYFAVYLSSVLNKGYGKLFVSVVIFTYLLGLIGSLPDYLGKIPPAALPLPEQQALTFLSRQPQGTVLTVPYDAYLKKSFPTTPIPLYAYETTAYVSAYSHQLTFLEDEMNLRNSGFDVESRRKASLDFFSGQNIFRDRGFLVNNQIDYIYIAGLQKDRISLNVADLYLQKIFENSQAIIYRVQR